MEEKKKEKKRIKTVLAQDLTVARSPQLEVKFEAKFQEKKTSKIENLYGIQHTHTHTYNMPQITYFFYLLFI